MIKEHLLEARTCLDRLISDDAMLQKIEDANHLFAESILMGGKILSCGNGGSMCDAMHFAEELSGRFREDRRPLGAIAISDASYLTCVGNDYGFEEVFSRFVLGLGREGDVLLAISTSGKSPNVLKAAAAARSLKMKVVGLSGVRECLLADLSDVHIATPGGKYADRVQELHIKIIHAWIDGIEERTRI